MHNDPIDSQELLENLCALLEDELERQETVLDTLHAQREALEARDQTRMDRNNTALTLLAREARESEGERRRLVRQLAPAGEIAPEEATLSRMVELAEGRMKRRLESVQADLQRVLQTIQDQVRGNARVARHGLSTVQRTLRAWNASARDGRRYTRTGAEVPCGHGNAAFLDWRG